MQSFSKGDDVQIDGILDRVVRDGVFASTDEVDSSAVNRESTPDSESTALHSGYCRTVSAVVVAVDAYLDVGLVHIAVRHSCMQGIRLTVPYLDQGLYFCLVVDSYDLARS